MTPWITPLAIGLLILLLGGWLAAVRRRMSQSRKRFGLGDFLRHFDPSEVSEEVVVAVYAQTERWESRLAPRPEHDLSELYGLLPEEIAHAVDQVAARCGRTRGGPDAKSVRTIEDWIREVSNRPADSAGKGAAAAPPPASQSRLNS